MKKEAHWEDVYRKKAPDAVSWYSPHLETSLKLIRRSAKSRDAAIIDVGAGESTLVDDLLAEGYRDLTVLDISQTALEVTKKRLGDAASRVHWICADVTRVPLPSECFDVWHDRAVFHFLTSEEDRAGYVENVARSVKPGGFVIVSAFGPEGPEKCSGLDVMRYDAQGLHGEFGRGFGLVESTTETHHTPWGAAQQFIYCYCRVF